MFNKLRRLWSSAQGLQELPPVTVQSEAANQPELAQVEFVDVSAVGARMHFALPIRLEQEAFGVLVTRRQDATQHNLTPYESARLIDVIVHATEFRGQCHDEPRQFNIWVVQSDAKDGRPRNLWLQLEIIDGCYMVRLTDA
jgi:hypothetical protein